MVNYEQWSWPDQTVLPDLEKSHQSGKKALPEMEKSCQSGKKCQSGEKGLTGFHRVQRKCYVCLGWFVWCNVSTKMSKYKDEFRIIRKRPLLQTMSSKICW